MPAINPSLVPTIAPGSIFTALTTDSSLNVRWLTASDPAFYEAINRPMADITLRQLILAKALDTLNYNLGRQAIFPFIIQPKIGTVSGSVDVPLGWIWDLQISVPVKWKLLRLARIKRISGVNNTGTGGYTGKLRLIFTAVRDGAPTETALLQADYQIDSGLTYQLATLSVVPAGAEPNTIPVGEVNTVAGYAIFRTLNQALIQTQAFYNEVKPPANPTATGTDGVFSTPATYDITDFVPNNPTGTYGTTVVTHGTGLLSNSAWAALPALNSDLQVWLETLNYPFGLTANRISTAGITIPKGLFREFDIAAPAGDQPNGDTTGTYYPVWVSKISKIGTGSDQMRWTFATFNVTDVSSGGTPSLTPIEFATLDLTRTALAGDVVAIQPINNLKLQTGAAGTLFNQHFGRGHVVLSSLWDPLLSTVTAFFNQIGAIAVTPPDTTFSQSSTRLSSFAISRVPKYIPTIGQNQALAGSTARRAVPIHPSHDNRYVTESDQGPGDQIDLEAQSGITPHTAIERHGRTGSLCHRIVRLVTDGTKIDNSDTTFYTKHILPRLKVLLGRDPQFGDFWWNGSRVLFFNGDTWQG